MPLTLLCVLNVSVVNLPILPHAIYIPFVFALGACIGSFLNVVVYRLPRNESLSSPPSHCPRCDHRLAWYDNIPIVGWLKLGGKCRHCRNPISIRYPIVETVTALLFTFYYVAYFVWQWRTCGPGGTPSEAWNAEQDWPLFLLTLYTLASLLAASLIDVELYMIPTSIAWWMAAVGVVVMTLASHPGQPAALNLVGEIGRPLAALAAGGTAGWLLALALWFLRVLPVSFPDGEPLLDVDRAAIEQERVVDRAAGRLVDESPLPPPFSSAQIRVEMSKEMLFLLLPLVLGGASLTLEIVSPHAAGWWSRALTHDWFSGLLGSCLGALVGALVVWVTRILATLAFGRVAMGLGDVHLMFGVGAVVGATGATVAFFIAPFFGILLALYLLISRRGREMPLGPYLSLATAFVMLAYGPIVNYLVPGFRGLVLVVGGLFGHGDPGL